MVPSPTMLDGTILEIGGLQLSYPLLSQEQVKLWRKWSVGVCRHYPNSWVPPIISGRGKATDFKFGGYIYRTNPNKSPLKILGKGERGRNQGVPKIFWAPMYKAHCAVIFAIAQLSCF